MTAILTATAGELRAMSGHELTFVTDKPSCFLTPSHCPTRTDMRCLTLQPIRNQQAVGSNASEEQAAAASEVAASMDNFGGITHQVAVSSRESAKTSQQLSDLATELQRSADRFRM